MHGRRPRSSYVPRAFNLPGAPGAAMPARDSERLREEIQALALELAAKNAQIADLKEQLRQARVVAQRPRMHLNQPDRFSLCQNEAFQREATKAERLRQQISQLERIKQIQFAALQQECQVRADSAFQKAQQREAALESGAAGLRGQIYYLQRYNQALYYQNERLQEQNQLLRGRGAQTVQELGSDAESAGESDFEEQLVEEASAESSKRTQRESSGNE